MGPLRAPAADGSRTAQGHKRDALDTCRRVPVPLSGCFVQGGCTVGGIVSPVEKKTRSFSRCLLFSNAIYSLLFTLCICLQTCKCYGAHKAGWAARKILSARCRRERPLTDTASSMPARTLKWHYSLFSSFSLSPSLRFFFRQSGVRVPWQQNWAQGWGLVAFRARNDTSFARFCRWLRLGDLQRHPSRVGIAAWLRRALSLRQPSCWPWAESGVSCPLNCIPPTPLHPETSHDANSASEGEEMTGSVPVTAGGWSLWWIALMIFN